MIKIENVEVVGWEPAIRGMRNSYNSWDKSDSYGMDEDFKIGPKKDFAVTGLALDQIMEVDGTQND